MVQYGRVIKVDSLFFQHLVFLYVFLGTKILSLCCFSNKISEGNMSHTERDIKQQKTVMILLKIIPFSLIIHLFTSETGVTWEFTLAAKTVMILLIKIIPFCLIIHNFVYLGNGSDRGGHCRSDGSGNGRHGSPDSGGCCHGNTDRCARLGGWGNIRYNL